MTVSLTASQTPHFEADALIRLHALLEELANRYENARDTLLQKRENLVGSQANAIKTGAMQAGDQTLLAISKGVETLESERQQLQTQMGCPDWKLEDIIRHVSDMNESGPIAASRLITVRQRLERAVLDTHRLNQETQALLELSLGWIRETVNVISAAIAPEGSSYTAQGKKARQNESRDNVTPASLSSTVSHSA